KEQTGIRTGKRPWRYRILGKAEKETGGRRTYPKEKRSQKITQNIRIYRKNTSYSTAWHSTEQRRNSDQSPMNLPRTLLHTNTFDMARYSQAIRTGSSRKSYPSM